MTTARKGFPVTTANASWVRDMFGPDALGTVNYVPARRTVSGIPVRNRWEDQGDEDGINPGWEDRGDEYTGPCYRESED